MYTVYIIENSEKKLYVGLTSNFPRRLRRHRKGGVTSTNKGCTDWQKIHSWESLNYIQASKLERWLHRLKPVELLDVILDIPLFNDWLRNTTGQLPTTDFEKNRD